MKAHARALVTSWREEVFVRGYCVDLTSRTNLYRLSIDKYIQVFTYQAYCVATVQAVSYRMHLGSECRP